MREAQAAHGQQRDKAYMTKGQQNGPMQRRPRQPRKLATHPAFAPILGIWGAALAGLCVLVLPARLIAQLGGGSVGMLLGPQAQAVLAGGAAAILGGTLFVIATGQQRKSRLSADAPSLVSLASRHVRAIDPKRELGSDSLDEPLASLPLAAIAEPAPSVADCADPWAEMPPPVELDLAHFAELPGRNAVWVAAVPGAHITDATSADPTPAAKPAVLAAVPETPVVVVPAAHPGTAALAHLRAQPSQDLSLAQMVERFAGALHEHRAGIAGAPPSGRDLAAREAALAEALKALAALSGFEPAPTPKPDEPLRDALTRLQGLRGAA